jgi:hypothetical protein
MKARKLRLPEPELSHRWRNIMAHTPPLVGPSLCPEIGTPFIHQNWAAFFK